MAEKGEELAKVGTVGSGSPGHEWIETAGRVSIGIPVQASKVLRGCSTGVRVRVVVIMPSTRVQCANFLLIDARLWLHSAQPWPRSKPTFLMQRLRFSWRRLRCPCVRT